MEAAQGDFTAQLEADLCRIAKAKETAND